MTTDGLIDLIQASPNQRNAGTLCARAMRIPPHDADEWDWTGINAAIRERWPKGLERVKRIAWKEHEELRAAIRSSGVRPPVG